MASQLEDKTIFIGNLRGKCPGSSVVQVAIYSLKLVVISIVICGILLQFPLRSVCISVPTSNDVENATKVERLIMGQFVSSALFELSESGALSSSPYLPLLTNMCSGDHCYVVSFRAITRNWRTHRQ